MASGEYGHNHPHRSHVSHNLTLAAVSSLFAVTLIVITIFIFCKYRQNRSQNPRYVDYLSRLVTTNSFPTRGLDPAVLNSLPVFAAAAMVGGAPPAECSVCLGDVAGEKAIVRLLPNCGHSFHVDCVDKWLASHTTCPLCRAEVEPEPSGVLARASPVDEISSLNGEGEVSAAAEGKASRLSSFKRMVSSRERCLSARSLEMVIQP